MEEEKKEEENDLGKAITEALMEAFEKDKKPLGVDLTIRKGESRKLYDPVPVDINGHIDAPYRWIKARKDAFEHRKAHILVNRDEFKITLAINDRDHFSDQIVGTLEESSEFKDMGINNGDYLSAFDLADLIKKNRIYFCDKLAAMKLVTELRKFNAKVNSEIEESDDKRGNTKMNRSQVVTSNIPEGFSLSIPVFKGQKDVTFKVEIEVNPTNLSCTLTSSEANDYVKTERDTIIDEQLENITKEANDIVIIEV
jgi:hypothetical protein